MAVLWSWIKESQVLSARKEKGGLLLLDLLDLDHAGAAERVST